MSDFGNPYATIPNFWATWDFGGPNGTFRQTNGKMTLVTNPGVGQYVFALDKGGLAEPYEPCIVVGNAAFMIGLADTQNFTKTLLTTRGNNVATDVDHGFFGLRRLAQ
jgi:hypothetical protein